LSSRLFDSSDKPSSGEEHSVRLDQVLRDIFGAPRANDESYAKALDEMSEANERRYNENQELKAENTELKLTLQTLRADIAELKAAQGIMQHRVERLVVDRKGDPGERGPQGCDGRPGERGEAGAKGSDAKGIVSWEPDPEDFRVTPIMSDGTRGAPLKLRPLFERYHSEVEGVEGRRRRGRRVTVMRGAEEALRFLRNEVSIAEDLTESTQADPSRSVAHALFSERRFLLEIMAMVVEKLVDDAEPPPSKLN
jgi:hypothetical protein